MMLGTAPLEMLPGPGLPMALTHPAPVPRSSGYSADGVALMGHGGSMGLIQPGSGTPGTRH